MNNSKLPMRYCQLLLKPELLCEKRAKVSERLSETITSGTYTEEQLNVLFDEYFPEFKVNLLAVIESHQAVYLMLDDDQKTSCKDCAEDMKRLF